MADYNLDGYDEWPWPAAAGTASRCCTGSSTGLSPLSEALAAPCASHYEGHGLLGADLDGDGDGELVVADYNKGVLVYRNRGVGVPKVGDLSPSLS